MVAEPNAYMQPVLWQKYIHCILTIFFSLLGILPASNGGRGGGSGRGRGGNRRPEISEADKTKVKLYKHKYEKYLKLKPITNSPFDILVKAAQVQPNFLYSS